MLITVFTVRLSAVLVNTRADLRCRVRFNVLSMPTFSIMNKNKVMTVPVV